MPPPRLRGAIATWHLLLLACVLPLALCANEQGEALLRWKRSLSTNGSSGVLGSWSSSDVSPCRWLGVGCDASGKVVSLSLTSVDLGGAVPASMLRPLAASLQTLALSNVNLTGAIPAELGERFAALSTLDLSGNSLTGAIPASLCRLTKLRSLALHTNSLTGAIPADIGNLTALTHLTLYDNELGGTIPASIGRLKKLQVLRAGGNPALKGPLPAEIGQCSDLTMLGLAETGMSGSLPDTIGQLGKLQTLAIYTTTLSGPIPATIGNCTELTSLYLYQNALTGGIPPELGQLTKLQNVLLWQNNLVGHIPPEIGNCKELVLIDLSLNALTGPIPSTFGALPKLQQLQLSTNKLTGAIPAELSNCTALTDVEVDNNELSGDIGAMDFPRLRNLTLFYAWQNRLTGRVPPGLAQCEGLQSLDLSYNNLTGPVPRELFALQNLTKLLLLSNELSGIIPPEIGNCTNLYRLRLNENRLSGTIPPEIGKLKSLNFLDLGSNRLEGPVPSAIAGCDNLEFVDLHSNALSGAMPDELPKRLQFVDVSDNRLAGVLGPGIGRLPELTKLSLGKNRISGGIPPELGSCEKLQLLDLGDNALSGGIPPELGTLPFLEISLNLSCNRLTGEIPSQFGGLDKLASLDVSYNQLSGALAALAALENLVTLNVSFNAFSGELPDTPFFQKLPLSNIAGNDHLVVVGGGDGESQSASSRRAAAMSALKLGMTILVAVSAFLLVAATYVLARSRRRSFEEEGRAHGGEPWEVTLYQKLDFSVDEVARSLTPANVIGTGSSGVVYRVVLPNGDPLAVKKMWSASSDGAFANEISALGSIRHRNIVRLLGWAANRSTKLLFYAYLPNGSLSGFLHRGAAVVKGGGGGAADWDARYEVALGVGHAVAYLHHDCLPAILHGDIKAMNVLLGAGNEPYLADFGLARVLSGAVLPGASAKLDTSKHRIAGSYGYIAPEYASMQRITEKSDVYSYGVVVLEMLTGRHPLDPTLPGGAHLVQWVRDHAQGKRELLDPRLRGKPEPEVQEMLQVFAVAMLCVGHRADDRPAMKDVVALLKEVRRPPDGAAGDEGKGQGCGGAAAAPDAVAGERRLRSPARSVLPMGGSSNCSFAMSDYST
ncbi:LRR receptor-like serine/threonine-protein kinase [Brachypodium distachyon]|uniref:Protein kinase domain-containing protein n=1 Tax=Brachypodium distachyon TaxID=15368 RepID=I1I867_BRADI|nr:LRR receptor-like serine/threonine-protein kinase [Brachypodium distachyon]KQJ98790.1 hypothetical protein BRADI_3g39150v3 [Brachypodium distachyon]|eukprot:XP_003572332.1 LRR receptor-like serine/threonine-protein kinase [Brachypodium distachyon]